MDSNFAGQLLQCDDDPLSDNKWLKWQDQKEWSIVKAVQINEQTSTFVLEPLENLRSTQTHDNWPLLANKTFGNDRNCFISIKNNVGPMQWICLPSFMASIEM